MRTYPSTELKNNLGDVLAAASQEPVSITRHSKPRYVLMSYEAYQAKITHDPRHAYCVSEMPDEHLQMLESALTDSSEKNKDD